MKVAVIGGGSTYTPELIQGFAARAGSLPVTELWLMDIDAARLRVVGGFAQRMAAALGVPFAVVLTTDQRAAVAGASYVCTQLRVGQMAARRADEYLGRRHGLIGQETTGVGGMAKALRTIPVILRLAYDMAALTPGALLVNFTNPAGLVTEALARYAPEVPAVGVCNGPITTARRLVELAAMATGRALDPDQAALDTLGLNHLCWHRGLTLAGEDLWPAAWGAYVAEQRASPRPDFDAATLAALRMIPNDYLRYFYYTDRMLSQQAAWPPSRAEAVLAIEDELLADYADPANTTPPPELMQRGGAYYSTVATQLLDAHYNNRGETHVVNVRHGGAVAGWPADWVLELPCRVDRAGVHPLSAAPLPPGCFGLVAQVKAYEQLTVEAAVHGDRRAAYQALLAHPLGPAADQVGAVLDDLLTTHRAYLPQFSQRGRRAG